jgi:transposase
MQKKYSKEFKREAVRLMVVDGLSGVEVSKKLGVNDSVIYRWKKEQLNEMEGVAEEYGQASPKEMSEEIHRLRKQLAKSERINEILKKQ